ncbi:MAG: nucleotidyltransferase family protein [Deltaproteobacteria bacterium]
MEEIFHDLLVHKEISVKQAMNIMDKTSHRLLFVVDKKNKLLGSITDGDIRRWIIKDGQLNESIEKVYNPKPTFFEEKVDMEEVKSTMLTAKIQGIPVVNRNKVIINILFWDDVFTEKFEIKKTKLNVPVVIMAGGKGTRLDPFTRILPKPLIPVGDKAILEIIIDNFTKYHIKKFHVIVNYKGEMIKSYFDNIKKDYKIKYIWEEKPLGTAGGLKLLPEFDEENFFLSNCDVIIKTEYDSILEFHKNSNNDLTIVASMQYYQVPYGVLSINNGGNLVEIKEKPEYNFLVNTGMYAIKTKIIKEIPEDKFFDMNELINLLKDKGYKIGVYPISRKSWVDIGQWAEYHNAVKDMTISEDLV